MKQLFLSFILFSLVSFAGFAGTTGQEPLSAAQCKDILKKMSQELSANKTLQAHFVQERNLVMFGDVLRSEGFLYYQKPGRIRWEFTKPYASITIMLEKGEVEKYDVIDGRAVRIETGARKVLAEVLTQISYWQKGDIASAAEDFEILMYQNTKYKLVLKPLSRGLAKILSKIEFEIDRHSFLAHSISLWEDEQDYTVIRFYDQKVNEKLPADLFNLEKPKLKKNN